MKKNQTKPKPKKAKTSPKKFTRRKKYPTSPIDPGVYLDIELVYKAINRVQTTRESVNFIITDTDTIIVENVLKDVELPFKRKKTKVEGFKSCFKYTVNPGKEAPCIKRLEDIEEFPDEIIEDGQVFF